MKICNVCRVSKPLEEFHKSATSPDGRQYRCKPCASATAIQWRKDHPEQAAEIAKRHRATSQYKVTRKARRDGPQRERILEQKRADYEKRQEQILAKNYAKRGDPKKLAAARAASAKWKLAHPRGELENRLKRTYKTTLDWFDAQAVAQSGLCAICFCQLTDPHIDHDHVTGVARGLLCSECNHGLGKFQDSTERLRAAIAYLS